MLCATPSWPLSLRHCDSFCSPMAHTIKSVSLRIYSWKFLRKDNVKAHCQGYA